MLLKIKYKDMNTYWMKDNFSEFEIEKINTIIKKELKNIAFNKEFEGYICETKSQHDKILEIIIQFSKNTNLKKII